MKAKFSITNWVEVKGEPGAKYQIRHVQYDITNNQILYTCHAQFPKQHSEWPSMTDRMVGLPESVLSKV